MPMVSHSVFLPAYSIGTEVYAQVPDICAPYGRKAVVIGGRRALLAAGDRLRAALQGADLRLTAFLPHEGATPAGIDRLTAHPDVRGADMIFAMGGGRCLDACKALAHGLGKPVFTFPTVATNCAACTRESVLYAEDGAFLSVLRCQKPPAHTFIDTQIIAQAPAAYLFQGMGGALAKEYEGAAGPAMGLLGLQMARTPLRPLFEYGEQAMRDAEGGLASDALAQAALDIIVRAGLSAVLTENGPAAHALQEAAPRRSLRHLPGAFVAYGALVLLTYEKQYEDRYHLFAFCRSLGLPTCLHDIPHGMEPAEALLMEASGNRAPSLSPDALHHAVLDVEAFQAMHCSLAV